MTGQHVPGLSYKNVLYSHPLELGSFVVIMTKRKSGGRFYIGEVLDLYSQSTSTRHGSVDHVDNVKDLSAMALRAYLVSNDSEVRGLIGPLVSLC